MNLVEAVLAGDRLALSRLLTQVENGTSEGLEALDALFPKTGKAHLVGITGAPGTGKSSLVNQLALVFRHPQDGSMPMKVAIVAVDPSSPFTGGALLGDRVRMRDLTGDPGIFIRSMASRGALGGLAHTTAAAVQILDAAGYEIILVETVGVGQSEIDIARLAYTTLVVEAPGMGDDIQTSKAGILEIADILVVNKADRDGVENTERALRLMLELAYPDQGSMTGHHGVQDFSEAGAQSKKTGKSPTWIPPILRTIAPEASGIQDLAQSILQHGTFLKNNFGWLQREKTRLKNELDELIKFALVTRWQSSLSSETYSSVLNQLCSRQISPYRAAAILLDMDPPRESFAKLFVKL
jgi:LAO/AO transport system kinase